MDNSKISRSNLAEYRLKKFKGNTKLDKLIETNSL